MTAETILNSLTERGITLALSGDKILSKPEIPGDLLPALKEFKTEIMHALRWRQNVEHLKQTFGAIELTGPALLRSEYNFCLAELRKIESYLDDRRIPLADREGRIAELQRLSRKLSDLLNAIGDHTDQEITEGFAI